MDRRSFLKGAAAAAAVLPAGAAAVAPAVAAAPAIETAGLSAIDAELGTYVSGQVSLNNAFVIYERGMCQFGPKGDPLIMLGIWGDDPVRPQTVPDLGKMQIVIRRTPGAEIENRFEVIE